MTENILICCLTVFSSLIVAFYAQYKTTKLKFSKSFIIIKFQLIIPFSLIIYYTSKRNR